MNISDPTSEASMTTNRISSQSPQANPGLNQVTPQQTAAAGTKVSAEAIQQAQQTTPAGSGASAKAPNYNVQISTGAKDRAEAHQKALAIAKGTPDVREDRVADLKKRIADGSYKPDAGNIADGMLLEAIRDQVATSR